VAWRRQHRRRAGVRSSPAVGRPKCPRRTVASAGAARPIWLASSPALSSLLAPATRNFHRRATVRRRAPAANRLDHRKGADAAGADRHRGATDRRGEGRARASRRSSRRPTSGSGRFATAPRQGAAVRNGVGGGAGTPGADDRPSATPPRCYLCPAGSPGGWAGHIPDVASFLTGAGLDVLGAPGGQAPRTLRDIQAGQAAGRFTIPSAELALAAVAGDLLGLLWLHQRHPDRIAHTSVDRLAEATLRLLDVPAAEAARLVTLPLEHQELVPLPGDRSPRLLDCRADVRCDYLLAAQAHMRGPKRCAGKSHQLNDASSPRAARRSVSEYDLGPVARAGPRLRRRWWYA
jgi:hypothetical protein